MEEILYLEPDEEITSVIDKLKKSQSKSIGLVVPRNSSLIHSLVNLKLLKKEAESKKKEIALVTADKIGKNIASQVGILVYEDVHAKRPINAHSLPEMPRGDEVIEVDMSGGAATADDEKSSGDSPKIRHYSAAAAAVTPKPIAKGKDAEPAEIIEEDEELAADHSAHEANEDESQAQHEDPNAEQSEDEPLTHRSAGFSRKSVAAHESHEVRETTTRSVVSHSAHGDFRGSGKRNNRKALIVGISIFLVIVLGTLLGLPQSTVLVTVAAENFEKTNSLTVDTAATEANNDSGTVPGRLIETTNSDARRIVATGKKDVGNKAKGTISISNAWDSNSIKFTAGTAVTATEGKIFTLSEDVTVPGGTATLVNGQIVTTPGKASAAVAATESGESYNIQPTRFTIAGVPADRQAKIYGESSKEFTGGSTKQVSVMTQGDIDGAKEALVTDLGKTAIDQIKKELKDEKLMEDAISSEVDEVTTNPAKADTETDYFDIKVTAKHKVIVFSEPAVNGVVNALLQKETPKDKELLVSEGDEFAISLDKTDYGAGKLTLTSQVKTKVGTRVDLNQVKDGANGKNQAAILAKLQSVPNVKDVAVHTFPGWWWQDTSFFSWNTRYKVVYE